MHTVCTCRDSRSFSSIPLSAVDTTVFGVVLETAIQHSTLGEDGIELPTVFRECIDHLETTGKYGHKHKYYT